MYSVGRIIPIDLLINTFGTRIRSSGERIVLAFPHTKSKKLAIDHDIDIVYLGSFEKSVGRIFPSSPKGITHLRRAQLATANKF